MNNITKFRNMTMGGFASFLSHKYSWVPSTHYRVRNVIDSPRVLAVSLYAHAELWDTIRQKTPVISQAMGLDEDANVRVVRGGHGITRLEIPKPKLLCYSVKSSALPNPRLGGLKIPIGLGLFRQPVYIDFTDPLQAHVLIAGTTGSGKTWLQKTIAMGLIKNHPIVVIDTEKRGRLWRDLENKENMLHPVVTDPLDALRMFTHFGEELDRREREDLVPPNIEHQFIFVDEMASLLESPVGDAIRVILQRIATVGREYGLRIVTNTQNPIVDNVGSSTTKHQLNVRLVGKLDDGTSAKTATGCVRSGAEFLSGAGDFLLINTDGVNRFQGSIPESADILRNSVTGKTLSISDVPIDGSIPQPPGRPIDPLSMGIVGQVLCLLRRKGHPQSMNTLGSWIKPSRIGEKKAARHYKAALEIIEEMDKHEYEIRKRT